MNNIILSALIGIVFSLIFFTPIIKQKIKLLRDLKALEAQDEKLKEMTKQKDNDKYDDFTSGHLYQ